MPDMWARWVLAIGLGLVLLYIGLVHGLLRQDISRTTDDGPQHITGKPATLAGSGIAAAGLALIVLGVTTALSWRLAAASYLLWALFGAGVATFFLALRRR
ncbi:MAG TPA: hypothetical protein VIT43_13645 [Candidatus Dormibacteraeota bacterium]